MYQVTSEYCDTTVQYQSRLSFQFGFYLFRSSQVYREPLLRGYFVVFWKKTKDLLRNYEKYVVNVLRHRRQLKLWLLIIYQLLYLVLRIAIVFLIYIVFKEYKILTNEEAWAALHLEELKLKGVLRPEK